MTSAILTDVTLCTGCESCVQGCKDAHDDGPDMAFSWLRHPEGLSSTRRTAVLAEQGRYVRFHCRHCLDPACVQACIVGALRCTDEGAVTYDPDVCIGCRYCMLACPFGLVRYEWERPSPLIVKCTLCHEAIEAGERTEPACVSSCPTGATIFGDREELLAEARRRINGSPDRYVDHIWGEHDLGGTSVLYISDVPLEGATWPQEQGAETGTELTRTVMHAVPPAFVGVAALMGATSWVIGRRQKLEQAEAEKGQPTAQSTGDDTGKNTSDDTAQSTGDDADVGDGEEDASI